MTGRRILLLNVLILTGILVCAEELISGWQQFKSERNLGQVVSSWSSQSGTVGGEGGALDRLENLQHDFFVIPEKDLFSPERRPDPEAAAEEMAEQAPEFPKRPRMTGVTERGGERVAFLTTYESPKDAAGKTEEVTVGYNVDGYVITEITDTTLTLTWNDRQVVIDMLDSEPSGPVAAAPAKVAALNIIRIGSKVAAVETTTPETAETEESRGLQVGIVGGQTTGSAASRTGLSGRGGMMGRGSSLGRGMQGGGTQGRGYPPTVGGMGGVRQGYPNQQRRY